MTSCARLYQLRQRLQWVHDWAKMLYGHARFDFSTPSGSRTWANLEATRSESASTVCTSEAQRRFNDHATIRPGVARD